MKERIFMRKILLIGMLLLLCVGCSMSEEQTGFNNEMRSSDFTVENNEENHFKTMTLSEVIDSDRRIWFYLSRGENIYDSIVTEIMVTNKGAIEVRYVESQWLTNYTLNDVYDLTIDEVVDLFSNSTVESGTEKAFEKDVLSKGEIRYYLMSDDSGSRTIREYINRNLYWYEGESKTIEFMGNEYLCLYTPKYGGHYILTLNDINIDEIELDLYEKIEEDGFSKY